MCDAYVVSNIVGKLDGACRNYQQTEIMSEAKKEIAYSAQNSGLWSGKSVCPETEGHEPFQSADPECGSNVTRNHSWNGCVPLPGGPDDPTSR